MKRYRWYLVGVVIGILGLGLWWAKGAGPAVAIDLIERLPQATQQRPSPEAFKVIDIALAGTTKRAIYAAEPSRVIWEEVVPEGGWLQVNLGVREEAWKREGSGVLFLVGISHAGRYEELVSLVVNPFANDADRQWLPLLLDLSPWAGQKVEVIFNTRIAHKDATAANHLALWGAPAIVTR